MRASDLEPIRRKLLDRQRALLDGVDGLEADLHVIEEGGEAELEERGQGEAMARLLDRVRERDRRELEEIYRALAKIPAGVYGLCEGCEEPIALGRLAAIPETRCCVECERERERGAGAPSRPFEPGSHRAMPGEYVDLDDEELAEAVRDRIRTHGDPDLVHVTLRCHRGVVRLSGAIPSEVQRQVLVQIIEDGMGLEAVDRLRIAGLDREDVGDVSEPEPEGTPAEERIAARHGMQPLAPEPWRPPTDEGEPPEAPTEPIPETE